MNVEEILFRIGVNAQPLVRGLARLKPLVKSWAAGVANDLKGMLGRWIAIGTGVKLLGEIKQKILDINRVSKELGTSTNFVQGLFKEAEKTGVEYETLAQPLKKFNALLGEAKNGSLQARKTLVDLGIATKNTKWETINFTKSLGDLFEVYSKLDAQRRDALLVQAGMGRGGAGLMGLAAKGRAGVEGLESGHWWNKISGGTVDDYNAFHRAWLSLKGSLVSIGANALDLIPAAFRKTGQALGTYSVTGGGANYREEMKRQKVDQQQIAETEEESLKTEEDRVKVQEELNSLLERQHELQTEIADRDKATVSELASRYAKLTGQTMEQFLPHSVTPLMRQAFRIQTLEERAKFARSEAQHLRFRSEADRLRAALPPWATTEADRNPLRKTEVELGKVNDQLKPVKEMAELVNREHKK